MILPQEFENRMRVFLEDEYEEFYKSYEKERFYGLRINTLKVKQEDFEKELINQFELKSIPWVKEGFYYNPKKRPGKHPYHDAGIYYIQEPSAMAVATFLEAKPGDFILDLCAAPGGKTTQIAAALQGEGLLVSNEIHPSRAKILSQNVERMGIKNAIVTNEPPDKLADFFPAFFDKIVVDAPCSGEGMFKKEENALKEWSLENVLNCAVRQREVLTAAAKMLKPGGRLVYSTCTFAPEENEGTINSFLEENTDFQLMKTNGYEKFSNGCPKWVRGVDDLNHTFRLWPHKIDGEGHYIAVLQKKGTLDEIKKEDILKPLDRQTNLILEDFLRENLNLHFSNIQKERFILFGDHVYLMPYKINLKGLKVLRPGLHLGTIKKARFEPSHALALALQKEDVKNWVSLECDAREIISYLKGETIIKEATKGWNLLLVHDYPIGWVKANQGILKNHYPKGLRWL